MEVHGESSRVSSFPSFGFGRPGGQKSNKSKASTVHGPCSLRSSMMGIVFTEVAVRFRPPGKALGSDSDLRNGALVDLLPFKAPFEGLGPETSSISSKIDCVELEGMNSSLGVELAESTESVAFL